MNTSHNKPTRIEELKARIRELEEESDRSVSILEGIKQRGLSLAVDDFGTGYSSLYYLKRLPIDVLKIDKSFVDEVATDPNDQAIVATIIAMGTALNLTLVAEGIETVEQERFLTKYSCGQGQGYLYGKPISRDAFVAFLGERMNNSGRQ